MSRKNWDKVANTMFKNLPADYKDGESGWGDLKKLTEEQR